MPAIVKGDDGFLYVLKFRGAGHGTKALIAELLGGELARAIGLKMPELVFMHLDDSFARTEPDEEIQDLLKSSVGLNLGLHFLSTAIAYDPIVSYADPLAASKVVLLDSLISNIDRTARNTNLLNWNRELWLIDHGSGFYFHHNWNTWRSHLDRTFPQVKDHVLLPKASELDQASKEISSALTTDVLELLAGVIPDDWLTEEPGGITQEEMRLAYLEFLASRVSKLDELTREAKDARLG